MTPTLGLGQPDIGCFATGRVPLWWRIVENILGTVIVLCALAGLILLAPFMLLDRWLRGPDD